jgi:hypothetical protein
MERAREPVMWQEKPICTFLGRLWPGRSRSLRRLSHTQRAGVEFAASQRGGVREYRVGVGWRRFERAFGGDWGPPHSQPRPAMEPGAGLCSLGTKPSVRRVELLWWAVSADLLGLGSWECSLRLPLRGLARSDRRVGQSVADKPVEPIEYGRFSAIPEQPSRRDRARPDAGSACTNRSTERERRQRCRASSVGRARMPNPLRRNNSLGRPTIAENGA